MSKHDMRVSVYQGDTYGESGSAFHRMLREKNHLIKKAFGTNQVVVAAPHHTPKGVDKMPTGRAGDENAGYLARNVADHLKGTMVVAANAEYDPNKEPGPYESHIVTDQAKVIVETHGHAGSRTRNDIEISCGTKELNKYSKELAEKIRQYLLKIADKIRSESPGVARELRGLIVEGDFDKIYFKASNTRSLQEARRKGIVPYHIEHITKLRTSSSGTQKSLPEVGVYVTQAISAALAENNGDVIRQKSRTIEDLLR